ncbi:MAG: hypothetical protein BWX89_00092 [candidate division TA06 bacterium ADurb.Bin131]|uniref:Uncharacterized protein n=1 Tax=candidate division TA06 bacterium ADurb.Bin131 TaxID=1852827 RepID=A0A1V6CEE7_UNCT6|nr:MAG: hypothetical protein BWX89_01072 [candidate division TA06 bacterium ADurb.Bin131]OQB75233.1 MAG: hypothetical protein BWX89_00092 [candidate division TA06 bacterium ADurb.Bin131]
MFAPFNFAITCIPKQIPRILYLPLKISGSGKKVISDSVKCPGPPDRIIVVMFFSLRVDSLTL